MSIKRCDPFHGMDECAEGEFVGYEDYEKLERENTELRKTLVLASLALALILPMAKAYAHQNQVGSNLTYIPDAEEALNQINQVLGE